MSCASTSISPETRFGLAPPSGRSRTRPVTRITNSLRSDSAAANVAARSGLKTICTRPSRSRRSTKMTPPWSRRRCTQPISVTVVSEVAAVDASTVVSALQGILRRALRAVAFGGIGSGRAGRTGRGAAGATAACPSPGQFRERTAARQRRGRRRCRATAARRDDAHRNDVLERVVDRHVELAHRALRHHHEVAAGRVGRRRHVDADVLARKVVDDGLGRRAGQERDRPAAGTRELDQQRLAEGGALVGEHGVADLLDRRVDRLDEGDAAEQAFPHQDEALAEEVGGEDARDEQDHEAQQRRRDRGCESRPAPRGAAVPARAAASGRASSPGN